MREVSQAKIVLTIFVITLLLTIGWWVYAKESKHQEVAKLEPMPQQVQQAQAWSGEDIFATIFYSILSIGIIVGSVHIVAKSCGPTRAWLRRELQKESTWAGIIILIFVCMIFVGIIACVVVIEDVWKEFQEEYEMEKQSKARIAIYNATSEEKKEARESIRRSKEYEKQWELEKALELIGE